MTRLASLALVLVVVGCGKSESAPPADPPTDPGAATPEPAKPVSVESIVTAVTSVKREATDGAKVEVEGKQVSNWVATIQRGERVKILDENGDWARIALSDATEGWLKKSQLLPADGVTEATVLESCDTFDRPDLVAMNAKTKIEPGTLLFVTKTTGDFSEVNLSVGKSAWVLGGKLVSEPREVMAAKLLGKAAWLAKNGKAAESEAVKKLAQDQVPDAKLFAILSPPVAAADAPADDANVEDAQAADAKADAPAADETKPEGGAAEGVKAAE